MKRFTLRAAVYAVFIQKGDVLLLRRFQTGWQDGMYSLPAGHLDGDETVTEALIREVREETGVHIQPEDFRVAHVMHRQSNDTLEYIDFFCVLSSWEGEPKITEPDKCDELRWAPLTNLPEAVLPYIKKALTNIHKDIYFSESFPITSA